MKQNRVKQSDKFNYNTLLKSGTKFYNLKQYKKALPYFEKIIKEFPNESEEGWKYLLRILLKLKKEEKEIIKVTERAIKNFPSSASLHRSMALSLLITKRPNDSLKSINKSIKLDSKKPESWFTKGRALSQLGKMEEALKAINTGLKIDSKDEDLWMEKGVILSKLDKPEEAIKCFDKVIKLDSKYQFAFMLKAASLSSLNQKESALHTAKQAVKIDPKNANALYTFATILSNFNATQSLAILDKVISIDPENIGAWHKKAEQLSRANRFQEALISINKALELDPNNFALWYTKGRITSQMKNYNEALKCYNKSLDLNPKNPAAWISKGTAYFAIKQDVKAKEMLKKALRVGKNALSPEFIMMINMLTSNYDSALLIINRLMQSNPKDVELLKRKAEILAGLKKYKESLKYFDEYLKINPNNGSSWYNKACVQSRLGDLDQSINSLSVALALDPEQKKLLLKDDDLKNVRKSPRFKELFLKF